MALSRRSCLCGHPPRPPGGVGRGWEERGKQLAVVENLCLLHEGATSTSSSLSPPSYCEKAGPHGLAKARERLPVAFRDAKMVPRLWLHAEGPPFWWPRPHAEEGRALISACRSQMNAMSMMPPKAGQEGSVRRAASCPARSCSQRLNRRKRCPVYCRTKSGPPIPSSRCG